MDKDSIFVGRQPIYNPNLGLFAYELLFRSNADNNHSEITISGDEATSKVFVNTFLKWV
ncbi:Predicted signal transduction protein [hydrothermal vent metagenome]|uniref:Predicted signal transduction protein n=1 Tax=hydrothermal vent metagenome TaxID=652676 RepID=A0A3B0X1S4_9ZZZZ